MKKNLYLSIALLSLLISCSENTLTAKKDKEISIAHDATNRGDTSNNINEGNTKQVLEHHWEAFSKNNMEEVMADYTEESVLITPDAMFKGLAGIRSNFENAFKKFPADKSQFTLNKSVVDRDVAYILWQAKTPTFHLTFATDTFVIRDGKIVRQTYAGVAVAL